MPSAKEFHDQLLFANAKLEDVKTRLDGVNTRLDAVKAAADAVRVAVEHVDKTLQWGFGQLITLGTYTNQALHHNAKQNDTMICILENISKNTCEIVNQSHLQTDLQTVIKNNTTALAELYAATHAEAALVRERDEALRKKIEECCPPKPVEPVCRYRPCPATEPLREPSRVDERPPR